MVEGEKLDVGSRRGGGNEKCIGRFVWDIGKYKMGINFNLEGPVHSGRGGFFGMGTLRWWFGGIYASAH